jgi:hypothetical protein
MMNYAKVKITNLDFGNNTTPITALPAGLTELLNVNVKFNLSSSYPSQG